MKNAILAALSAVALTAQSAPPARAAPDIKLWRLDCGTVVVNTLNAFSDTFAYQKPRWFGATIGFSF